MLGDLFRKFCVYFPPSLTRPERVLAAMDLWHTSHPSDRDRMQERPIAGVPNILCAHGPPGKAKKSQKKPWSTGATDLIMDFWYGLSEEERKNLVNMEKDTMRGKMRERQRVSSCSCAACGRKRCAPYPSFCPFAHPFFLRFSSSLQPFSGGRAPVRELPTMLRLPQWRHSPSPRSRTLSRHRGARQERGCFTSFCHRKGPELQSKGNPANWANATQRGIDRRQG